MTNQYLPFGTAGGANVLSNADYQALAARLTGFTAGTAVSAQLNSVWRQSSVVAAMIGQFISDIGAANAFDDGNVANLLLGFERAIQSGKMNFGTATGTVDTIVLTLAPAPASLPVGFPISFLASGANTGAVTINVNGLGAKPLVGELNQALQAGDLIANRIVFAIYGGSSFHLIGSISASETGEGTVELASAAEVAAGTDLSKVAAVARMAAAVQSGEYSYATNTGTVDALAVTLTPAPAALTAGFGVVVNCGGSNTGPATLNVNGLGAKNLLGEFGNQLAAGDLVANRIICAVYNGASFRIVGSINATESTKGTVELASSAEMLAGNDLFRVGSVSRMADVIQNQSWQYAGVAGGTVDALTLTLTPAPAAYTNGMGVVFVCAGSNTASAVTLNINGLGAKNIRGWAAGAGFQAGDFVQFRVVYAVYDGVNFNIMGELKASEAAPGIVELATAAEVTAGTDLARVAAVGRMSDIIQSGTWLYAVAGGTANALTATYTPGPPITDGMTLNLKITATNTGPVTLAVNGGTAQSIVDGSNAALNAGDLSAGDIIQIVRSSALGAWIYKGRQKGQLIGIRVFGTAGTSTYTPTPGTGSVLVEVQGGGGGGGGTSATGASQVAAGAGGGGGGFARKYITSGFSGVTITVGGGGPAAVGATGGTGGTSSFGALVSCTGGLGGTLGVPQSPSTPAVVGSGFGGTASGGDFNGRGGHGKYAVYQSAQLGGEGGSSFFGAGASPTSGTSSGTNATTPGSGGSGSNAGASVATGSGGGTGAAGIVFVWEFA